MKNNENGKYQELKICGIEITLATENMGNSKH